MPRFFTDRRADAWVMALIAASAAGIVASAIAGWGAALFAALLVNYVADSLLYAGDRRFAAQLSRWQLGAPHRALFRQTFAVLGWVLATDHPAWLIVMIVAGVGLIHLTEGGYLMMSARNRRLGRGRVRWVNLDVDGVNESAPPPPPQLPTVGPLSGPRLILHIDVFLVLGMFGSWALDSAAPAVVGVALVLMTCSLVAWRVVNHRRGIEGRATPEEASAHLRVALELLAPEVAVYFSGGRATTYQLNVWLETIDRLNRPTVIILRQAQHLSHLLPTTTPIVILPRARDVEDHAPASLKVALYPTTVIKNNHMIRIRGIRHVFINHGDGDKSVTYSPVHRVFDEIWVAGQAACDRYLTRGEGVRADQLVQVGRPQLAHIQQARNRRSADEVVTVLYAPTWEGNFDNVDYSSVAPMGEAIIEQLLRGPRAVRILFKAHPATGSRLPAAAEALARIETRLRDAPGGHEIMAGGPDALYTAFNEADVLIADISSVIADFLASRKPYIVTNILDVPAEQFQRDYPSTSGGGILQPDASSLSALIEDAVGTDTLRERREQLATYFLGAPVADPVEHFAAEVDRACSKGEGPVEPGEHPAADLDPPVVKAPTGGTGGTPMSPHQLPVLFLLALSFAIPSGAVLVIDERPMIAAALYGAALFLGVLAEWLLRRMDATRAVLERVHLGFALRSGVRDLVLLVLVAVWSRATTDTGTVLAVTLAVVLVAGARISVLALVAAAARMRDQPVSWRNLPVPGVVRVSPMDAGRMKDLGRWVASSTGLIGVGTVAVLLGTPTTNVVVASLTAVLMANGLLAIAAVDLARARRDTPPEETLELLGAALADYAPEVVFYYSRPEPAGYIANVWMPTLGVLDRPVLVIVRERHNEPLIETESNPVVRITRAVDLEKVLPPSVRMALYPSNVATNNHLIRLSGIVDVFIGHGDSDKGGSATVLSRIFDEIWVSGPAARDRYRVADLGVRDEQIHEVGRPQLATISQSAPRNVSSTAAGDGAGAREYTVLYAPTREGFYSEWDYSSVVTQGAVILGSLLALPSVRVLFKPHPGTGTDDPRYLVAVKALTAMVEQAGAPHEVVTSSEGLYDAFNRADLLVSDVSSVITDFLASGKPYIVTNFNSDLPDHFRRIYPSAAGAYVLAGDGSEVVAFLTDARTLDSLRVARERTARHLLGDVSQDPLQRFADAVSAAIARAPETSQ